MRGKKDATKAFWSAHCWAASNSIPCRINVPPVRSRSLCKALGLSKNEAGGGCVEVVVVEGSSLVVAGAAAEAFFWLSLKASRWDNPTDSVVLVPVAVLECNGSTGMGTRRRQLCRARLASAIRSASGAVMANDNAERGEAADECDGGRSTTPDGGGWRGC